MLIGRYAALLDANVLHPAFVRGALLWFADERLFRPCWSADILEEWRRSVTTRFPEADEQLARQQAMMEESFPDAEITGYARFITKHFPAETMEEYRIEVMHPDEFIVSLVDLDPGRASPRANGIVRS